MPLVWLTNSMQKGLVDPFKVYGVQIFIGRPSGTPSASQEKLEEMGLIGLYCEEQDKEAAFANCAIWAKAEIQRQMGTELTMAKSSHIEMNVEVKPAATGGILARPAEVGAKWQKYESSAALVDAYADIARETGERLFKVTGRQVAPFTLNWLVNVHRAEAAEAAARLKLAPGNWIKGKPRPSEGPQHFKWLLSAGMVGIYQLSRIDNG